VDLAVRLNWKVTLVNHRSAYAKRAHFPRAETLLEVHPQELAAVLDPSAFDVAVIMSHHLPSDLAYLRRWRRLPSPTSDCSAQPRVATSCLVTSAPRARGWATGCMHRSVCQSAAAHPNRSHWRSWRSCTPLWTHLPSTRPFR